MASLRDSLLGLRAEVGYLTPQVVVDAARPDDHPLHARFEWDDNLAGEAYRRDQAHRLIQSVRVAYTTRTDQPEQTRAFVAVPQPDSLAPFYEPVEEVATDPVKRQVVLAAMEREWRALRKRYGHLTEFMELVAATTSVSEEAA